MKLLPFFVAAALLLAGASATQAQDYRPFIPGITYHFAQAGSTASAETLIHLFRVDSVGTLGGDSVFYFNRNAHYGPNNVFTRLTLFGAAFRWHAPTGKATFVGAGGTDTVRILTRGPIGRQWNFTRSVRATIQSRQVQQVLGRPDTVLTVALSDGQTLQCSRTYGLVSGPALFSYLGTSYLYRTTPFATQICGLPERGMGSIDLRPISLYSLHSGDSLFYYQRMATATASPNPTCTSISSKVLVSQALLNPSHDTIVLRTQSQFTTQACVGGTATTSSGAAAMQWVSLVKPWLTGDTDSYGFGMRVVGPGQLHADSLGGRPRLTISILRGMGQDEFTTYAPGLSEVAYASGFGPNQTTIRRRLIRFVRNTAPLGIASTLAARLPATLAPNPATDAAPAAILHLTLDQPQTACIAVLDGLGRTVWQKAKALPVGEQALTIPTAALPSGLYHVRLSLADGRQRLLPLVRE